MRRLQLWPVAVVVGVMGLWGCPFGGEPPEAPQMPITEWRRECPKEWVFDSLPWVMNDEREFVSLSLLDPSSGTMTGPGKIQNVPEFNDCQRFVVDTENGPRFGELFGIWAVDTTRELALQNRTSIYEEYGNGGVALPAAEIVAWGDYDPLKIKEGFNCLYLIRRGGGASWMAFLHSSGPVEADCSVPRSETWLEENDAEALTVHSDMRAAAGSGPDAPPGIQNYPKVARWVWNPRERSYYIGIWCDENWCRVSGDESGASRAESFYERRPTPKPGRGSPAWRVQDVKGWHDEQVLAGSEKDESGIPLPSGIIGTVIPDAELGGFVFGDFVGQWRHTADVALEAEESFSGINPYEAKLNFDLTVPEGPLNQVFLCHGVWNECKESPDAPPPEDLCPTTNSWWAKLVPAYRSRPSVYTCAERCDPGVDPEGTARWRWRIDDEGIWMRCVNGCCEVGRGEK